MEKQAKQTTLRGRNLSALWRRLFTMLIGAFLCGIAVNVFYLPTRLTMGGISGIASIIYQLTGLPITFGLLSVLLNIPVFLLGLIYVSRRFLFDSLIGTLAYAATIDLTKLLLDRVGDYQRIVNDLTGTPDLFLCAIVGGAIFGLGLGFMLMSGFTTGGTDIIAVIIHRRFHALSMGMSLWIIDGIVIAGSAIAYQQFGPESVRLALYSGVSLYLTAKAIDLVLEGFNYQRTAIIISERAEAISRRIMKEIDRGVTGLAGRGMYTNQERTVLLCVLSSKQIRDLTLIASEEDKKAFVFVMDTREVSGEGFERESAF